MGRESINKIIGRNVRAYRIAGGMTQKDLAEAMNCSISQQHINRIEKGTLSLVPIKAFYVADALDISMKDIYAIGGESDDLFSDNNVVVILEAYKSLPDDKQKVAISEVMKCVSDQLKGMNNG